MANFIDEKQGRYTRNPETNRCRSIVNTTSTLTPCKPGQERNPETNRCRAVASAESELKPCAEGQERNPETNRCRKIAAEQRGGTNPQSVAATIPTTPLSNRIIAVVATLALLYGAYEFR